MREINISKIRDAVRELCLKANFELRPDVMKALQRALKEETSAGAKRILSSIIDNACLAKKKRIAICQDTGMVVVHIDVGQKVALKGGNLKEAIEEGVKEAYSKGFLRKSVVDHPTLRNNTGKNTPAVIFTDIVKGDKVEINVSVKGFGSENKSMIRMFRPGASIDEVETFVTDVARCACPDACPPLVLGVGIGGTFDHAACLAKKALVRSIDEHNPDAHMAKLEKEILKKINSLGSGPMGLGGKTTALGVNIMHSATHIAGLPVAVNVSCHATRSASKVL